MSVTEGFVDIDGEGFYCIPDVDRLAPFLMSIVSDDDHWMFVSSRGGLTAGRGDARTALFPYETDDRLHHPSSVGGPVTLIRLPDGDAPPWEPFRSDVTTDVQRNLYKAVAGDQVLFEEINSSLRLRFTYRWATSREFGFVRTATLSNLADEPVTVELLDGLNNLLPHGLDPRLYQQMSNLTNAYKRNELIDVPSRLTVFSLESNVVDRPEPAEVLIGTAVWSIGPPNAVVGVDTDDIGVFRTRNDLQLDRLVTGKPGAYLLNATLDLGPRESQAWSIVADVAQTQSQVVGLRSYLNGTADPMSEVGRTVKDGSDSLVARLAHADALQRSGDRMATAHHFANVLYNVMRGGTFVSDREIERADFVDYLHQRNGVVTARHQAALDQLPETIEHAELMDRIEELGDDQLLRLALGYLPLAFSRRHGDPSRPWNAFSIRVRDDDGDPVMHYEGNWRDIFQNWEALCMSFPAYLPGVVSVFLNASTADGFNPYRITRDGIDWEIPEPDNSWSNIGYWGDHQIVYLLRLLEATQRFHPGTLRGMLGRAMFSYADVPYRIVPYGDLVKDPKATIRYDEAAELRTSERTAVVGFDGKLLSSDGEVYLVTMLEKLLVPALAKLSNFVPDGGIWMNTQRPEWNDANNALVGHGLSMVTLYYLRRYLRHVAQLVGDADVETIEASREVAEWMSAISKTLSDHAAAVGTEITNERRRTIVDQLGEAFSKYRWTIYDQGFDGTASVTAASVIDLCNVAIAHLDDTIERNRRPDGLYNSYNLIDFGSSGAGIENLDQMLEGQVAVLSSGVLSPTARLELLQTLFESPMYRPDQNSFMLYPARRLPSFLEKNVVPADVVANNPLLNGLVEFGDTSVIVVDGSGDHRFNASFRNRSDLENALDDLGRGERWRELVESHRDTVLDTYEGVFGHHAYTGRSGSMYGYEGIGSIYWHMVSKLLVAVQESVTDAASSGAPSETLDGLIDMYWRIRSGLGFEKTAAEFGAFPIDAYSHTPAHALAQQPGMTGQVKEELLTRPLELGVRIEDGAITFDPILLRTQEFLTEPESWDVGGSVGTIDLEAGSLGLTVCHVPVIVSMSTESPSVRIRYSDGTERTVDGRTLDVETSRAVFERSGHVTRIDARLQLKTADSDASG